LHRPRPCVRRGPLRTPPVRARTRGLLSRGAGGRCACGSAAAAAAAGAGAKWKGACPAHVAGGLAPLSRWGVALGAMRAAHPIGVLHHLHRYGPGQAHSSLVPRGLHACGLVSLPATCEPGWRCTCYMITHCHAACCPRPFMQQEVNTCICREAEYAGVTKQHSLLRCTNKSLLCSSLVSSLLKHGRLPYGRRVNLC